MATRIDRTVTQRNDTEEIEVPVVRAIPQFEDFYRAEFAAVAGLAYALSGSRIAAEEIAQGGLLSAYRR